MNPFLKQTPLPAGACGERGYQSAAAAKDSVVARGVSSYAILKAGHEYAWVSPLEVYSARAVAAMLGGVHVVELHQ